MQEIVKKYLEGTATDSEQKELLGWLRKKENRLVYSGLKLDWEKSLEKDQFFGGGEESWNRLQAKLWQKSFNRWQESGKVNRFFRYAAIFFFALTLGLSAWYFTTSPEQTDEVFTKVVAENGHISKVELPDGSLVWLNSGSEISYSNYFASANRAVSLAGEAYFDVKRNEKLPLIIDCGKLHVRVLGTKFNVSAYPWNKPIEVVLEEGSVELIDPETLASYYKMKPGERVEFNKNDNELKVGEVNTSRYTSWKEGIINIYDQSLDQVVKRLEMRYNQKFEIDNEAKEFRYTFSIKNEPLEDIINLMQKITPLKVVQENNVIKLEADEEKIKKVDN